MFNDWTYPNFIRLLGQIGVSFKPTEMSFSVCDEKTRFEYNGNNLNSLFAQRRNILSPGFWGMLRDILRFNRQAPLDLQEQRISAEMTLGDYLTAGGYGERFVRHYIVPMGAAIWSMSLADMLEFSAAILCALLQEPRLAVGEQPAAVVCDRRWIQQLYRTADPRLSRADPPQQPCA